MNDDWVEVTTYSDKERVFIPAYDITASTCDVVMNLPSGKRRYYGAWRCSYCGMINAKTDNCDHCGAPGEL